MYNVIVGTAGHVDHGKTTLIKALTGTDTDRLVEEKKRGITIDLGFAEMPNDRNLNIGVIDVPGHEKFINNMLAGIGGIDLVLLVIAADESIMPQTAEHFEILKTLNIKRGIIALTKVDTVDEEWLEIVRDDIKAYMTDTFLENAPVVEVSAHTGYNIATLKELICDMAEKAEARRLQPELLRIPIDRVFTIDGFGTVVTGTLMEGTVAVGDEIEVYPGIRTAKVRYVQVHCSKVDKAYAGQRTALNLANIKKEDLQRGDVLAAKDSLKSAMMLDVKIDMFKDSPRILLSGSRLHLHLGSAEVLCKVILLDAEELESGQSGYAQLRLEEEIAVRKDDRFIIRFYSPLASIGGGVVLHSNPPRRKRFDEETLRALSVYETGGKDEILEQALLEESRKMPNLTEIRRLIGFSSEEMPGMINALEQKGKIVSLTGDIAVHSNYLNEVTEKTSSILKRFHDRHPLRPGMQKEEFRSRLCDKLFLKHNKSAEILIAEMTASGALIDNENTFSLPDFRVTYTPQMSALKDKIEDEYRKRGSEAPETEEILPLFKENEQRDAAELIEVLRREGRLEKLSHNCYIHIDCFKDAVEALKNFVEDKGRITLSEYRDLLGTSRKYAVRILEYLDQQNITRLIDDARVLI